MESVKKKRGRKRICDLHKGKSNIKETNNVDFGETTFVTNKTVSFGNLNIGVVKLTTPTKKIPKLEEVKADYSLCDIIIPDNLFNMDITPYSSGEYRVEEDYLLNIPKYKKNKRYIHKSIVLYEEVFPLFEKMSEHLTYPLEENTNVLCWWCCHRFDGTPKVLPTKYKNGKFSYTGNFCSWACVRAYTRDDASLCASYKENILTLFIYKIYKTIYSGRAPPRQALKVFGGNMSIHTFREASENFEYTKISSISAVLDRNIYLYQKKN